MLIMKFSVALRFCCLFLHFPDSDNFVYCKDYVLMDLVIY